MLRSSHRRPFSCSARLTLCGPPPAASPGVPADEPRPRSSSTSSTSRTPTDDQGHEHLTRTEITKQPLNAGRPASRLRRRSFPEVIDSTEGLGGTCGANPQLPQGADQPPVPVAVQTMTRRPPSHAHRPLAAARPGARRHRARRPYRAHLPERHPGLAAVFVVVAPMLKL